MLTHLLKWDYPSSRGGGRCSDARPGAFGVQGFGFGSLEGQQQRLLLARKSQIQVFIFGWCRHDTPTAESRLTPYPNMSEHGTQISRDNAFDQKLEAGLKLQPKIPTTADCNR